MKDLEVRYENNGNTVTQKYDCIFHLNEAIENGEEDAPPLNGSNVEATFFEKYTKEFSTIAELAEHCRKICGG